MRRRQRHPTPVLLPGKSHGWRGLVGCSPWGRQESDTTERLPFHFSLSCIGEGNGNPLQCSCLENPRDRGAWWAAVSGVAQSRIRLKRLSSSSSSILYWCFSFWLTSLCIIGSSFIHLIKTDSNVFFLMNSAFRCLYLSFSPVLFTSLLFTAICKASSDSHFVYHPVSLISHTSKVMLRIRQARLQQYMNHELPDVQAGFRKGRGTQRSNCQHLLDHRKSKRVPEKYLLLLY